MILIKGGVILRRLLPEIYGLFPLLDRIFSEVEKDCVITSAADGHHKLNSLHYKDRALDIRSHSLLPEAKRAVLERLQHHLGSDYDVILEHEGEENEHFHLEFDPPEPSRV